MMNKENERKEKPPLHERCRKLFSAWVKKRESEYSKRMLDKIVDHALLMMWGTYILAWFGKSEIAEALSKTIATSIIAVVIGYLAKSVIENISKHTTVFEKKNQTTATPETDDCCEVGQMNISRKRDC